MHDRSDAKFVEDLLDMDAAEAGHLQEKAPSGEAVRLAYLASVVKGKHIGEELDEVEKRRRTLWRHL